MSYEDIAERFKRETAEHKMTILHDDGLYRHLRFRRGESDMYRFDLITVPGTLIFQGDGESYVFSRRPDMFEFFRDCRTTADFGGPYGIHPQYWAEKITSDASRVKRYDEDLFRAAIVDETKQAIRDRVAPRGFGRAVHEFLTDDWIDLSFEHNAYGELDRFEYKGFRFPDLFDGDWYERSRDYHWWYLWACHAIVAGIVSYDTARAAVAT
ncbi:MAG: hypothetical protein ACRDT8_00140 [Micromonosporaceae bacterium]